MDEEGVVFLGIIFGFNSGTDEKHDGCVEKIMF